MTRSGIRRVVLVLLAVATAAAGATAVAVAIGPAAAEQPVATTERATAQVARRTLTVSDELDGQLAYGTPRPLTARQPGTLTATPAPGDILDVGDVVYEVDTRPVVLLTGEIPAWRSLQRGDRGEDVRQLKLSLAALGYGDGLTVDDVFGPVTQAAVKAWQATVGMVVDGIVDHGEVVFLPGAVRVASVGLLPGDEVGPGAPVIEVTGTDQLVSFDLPVARRSGVDIGDEIEIQLPDGTTATGVITEVATVPDTDPQSGRQTLKVTVRLADGETDASPEGPVKVNLVRDERRDVLAVPVTSLLALLEGGYALERVADDATTELVAVEVGLFADGWVEVRGEIAAGDQVVAP